MTQHKQSTRTRTSTKCSVRGTGVRDRAGATTTRGGGGTAVQPRTHDRASPCSRFAFSFAPFRLPTRFFGLYCEFAFKRGCIWTPSCLQIPLFHHFLHHLFLVLVSEQRERGSGEECKDFMPSLRSKDSSTILAKHFFSFSLLFSIQFYFL